MDIFYISPHSMDNTCNIIIFKIKGSYIINKPVDQNRYRNDKDDIWNKDGDKNWSDCIIPYN